MIDIDRLKNKVKKYFKIIEESTSNNTTEFELEFNGGEAEAFSVLSQITMDDTSQ